MIPLGKQIGALSKLNTNDKTSLVNSVNELFNNTYGNVRIGKDYTTSLSPDDLLDLDYISVYKFGSGYETKAGFPESCYNYGIIITFVNTQEWGKTQIIITDLPYAGGTRGIFIRTRKQQSWAKLTTTTVSCV